MIRCATLLLTTSFLLAAVPAAAAAPTPDPRGEAKLAKLLAGRTPGKPVDCIQLHQVRSTQVIDGTGIVYEGYGGRLYLNRPPVGAETLRDDDILVTRTWSDQLCSIDVVRLVDRGSRFERGFVGLGKFVPYEKPKKE